VTAACRDANLERPGVHHLSALRDVRARCADRMVTLALAPIPSIGLSQDARSLSTLRHVASGDCVGDAKGIVSTELTDRADPSHREMHHFRARV
jgi:hypothetical protein